MSRPSPARTLLAALACACLGAALLGPAAVPVAAANAPLSGSSVLSLAAFGGRLWAGTDSGLEVLSPGGTWNAVGGPIAGREINALAVVGGWLVVGTEDGAVRSRDGSSWVGAGLGGMRVASLSVAGSTLLAGTGHDTPRDGLAERSDDAGASWSPGSTTPALIGLSGDTVQAVLSPASGSPAFAGTEGSGADRSADGRGGWSTTGGMRSSWVTSFWRDPASGAVLAGSDDGLYSWTGSGWTAAAFPQADPWVQALEAGPAGHGAAGTYDGQVYTRDAAGHWTERASGLNSVLSLLTVSGGGLLVGTSDGLACVGCPAGIAAASAPPAGSGSHPGASLPPPGARGGSAAPRPGAGSTAAASAGATGGATPTADAGGAVPASASTGGGSTRWIIAGALIALAGLLLVVAMLRSRRVAED